MWLLTRYFLDNLFGRQLLDEDGIMALRRVLISAVAGLISIALYLPRLLHKKFADLDALADPAPYRQAVFADGFLMICLLLMLAAFVAALVAPAMFPSEVDYVTLTPLPLSRRRIFGAKVAALLIFGGGVILAVVLFFAISFPLFTHGRWAEHSQLARIVSFATAAAAAASFGFLAVMGAQGLVLTVLPRRWVARASMLLQSATIGGVILAAPLISGLAAERDGLLGRPDDMAFFPPAWFLGLEQTLLGRGDTHFRELALLGLCGLFGAAAVSLACYGWLFRRPERLAALPPKPPAVAGLSRTPLAPANRPGRARHGGAWTAVWMFATSTLARNRLPQLVFLVAWSAALAIVATDLRNGLDGSVFVRPGAVSPLDRAVVAMPFVLILLAVAGLRAAFLLPVSLQANWMFRMTDFPAARAERLDAVEQAFIRLAILPALAIATPFQLAALGLVQGLSAILLAALASAVLLELVLTGWRRVPFTCTWLPGKRPLPFALLALVGVLWVMSSAAASVAWAIAHPPRGVIALSIVLLAAALLLRWRRKRSWARDPLEFEDEPFDRVQRLGLGPS